MFLSFKEFLLSEKYKTRITVSWGGGKNVTLSIFENPSASDIASIKKAGGLKNNKVRFLGVATSHHPKVYAWDEALSIHLLVLDKLQKENIIPSTMNVSNVEDMVCGIAEWKDGDLLYDKDNNFEKLISLLKEKKSVPASRVPDPYKSFSEFEKALPALMDKYKFVGKYITGFNERNPFVEIFNLCPKEKSINDMLG